MPFDPWPIEASSGSPAYSGQELRNETVVPFVAGAGASLGVRSGVRPSGSGTDLLVQAQSSPNMTVKVNIGVIVVQGTISATQGAYCWALDATKNLTIGASHATLDRTDLICVRVRDANVDTSGSRDGDVVVVPGSNGGGVPALPTDASYVTIAQIAVVHAVTTITSGAITDRRPFTAAVGGVIVCTVATLPASAMPGQLAFCTDQSTTTTRWRYWDGAAWQYLHPVGPGITATVTGATTSTTSTTYADTTTVASVAFVAPASGVVEVTVNANQFNSTSNYTFTAFRLSGAGTYAANDNDAAWTFGTGAMRSEASTVVTGLTPGGSYTATMQHAVIAGTGTYGPRRIIVKPLAA